MADPAPRLPDVQQAVLDSATLQALFRDLAQFTQILAVIPKMAAAAMVAEQGIDLDNARAGLISGTYRGVQVRYRYDNQEWCDTLLNTPAGIKLVRICIKPPETN